MIASGITSLIQMHDSYFGMLSPKETIGNEKNIPVPIQKNDLNILDTVLETHYS